MEYKHKDIEQRWQQRWKEDKTYKTEIDHNRPKFYVLDMFPYPSGAGLHVGHPLGYIASDIYSRYKRMQGFNVLHPMGYDAYGLPAEQYAIQTGQHPEVTTTQNIARYRQQLDRIGFCYDWDREIRTCTPDYYKWTQWAFIEMFNHYYDTKLDRAEPVANLISHFSKHGTEGVHAACTKPLSFTAAQWNAMSEKEQSDVLMNYRIAFQANTMVNWCPKLGTVLANDEVSEGVSVRGGYPVEQKQMYQWRQRLCTASARRYGTAAVERFHQGNPAQLDRTLGRCRDAVQGEGQRCGDDHLHHTRRHSVRCDIHGAGTRKQICGHDHNS